ncbi:DedA family protein [Cellulomonas sp. McL0617]|uniref:DedA family protein n=1 Tax=Cellulomonas sp. McL0617 TaxID=3415675 RepID=UPI003CF3451B
MSGRVAAWLASIPAAYVYAAVFALVFAEDALFFGFVLPGETAVVVGGVLASRGHISLGALIPVVVVAAIAGDSVGYEIGRRAGPRILDSALLRDRRAALAKAEHLLRTRGRTAVFIGRFAAFFRATMPALAGSARMPYRQFLPANAAGGLVWGVSNAVLGYFVGSAYAHAASLMGQGIAVGLLIAAIAALVIWRRRRRRGGAGETVRVDAHERHHVDR